VPAESTSTDKCGARCASKARNTPSALGERQMLPMHTNKIRMTPTVPMEFAGIKRTIAP
jgi:hypothetical protein